ncbi:caspase family protein [Streptomyces sp. DT203]|uniref:caspase family protein n=1 Tax=Streptomyces sp. DT203 TaxID=3393424 RepID=UPI003CF554E3
MGLVGARERIIELFTGKLGYRHETALGMDPGKGQLTEQLRSFCMSADRREDDLLAIYISGHGEVLDDSNDHVLLTADTSPNDIAWTALRTARWLRTTGPDSGVCQVVTVTQDRARPQSSA